MQGEDCQLCEPKWWGLNYILVLRMNNDFLNLFTIYHYNLVQNIEGLERQRAICILAVSRKLALKICCCTVRIQIVRQYFWWYSTVKHLHQWALLLVGSWCSKDHVDTKTSFWPKMQIALCWSDPSIYRLLVPKSYPRIIFNIVMHGDGGPIKI